MAWTQAERRKVHVAAAYPLIEPGREGHPRRQMARCLAGASLARNLRAACTQLARILSCQLQS